MNVPRRLFALLCLGVAVPACGRGQGGEGLACYENGTCDPGLTCLSNTCVVLPGTDAGVDAGGPTDATSDSGDAGDPDGGVVCGDGVIEAQERCDGADVGGYTCVGLGLGFIGGTLACDGACELDDSGCAAPSGCGDGVVGAGEECDGANLGAATCVGFGFSGGTLGCTAGCLVDTTSCTVCGDGAADPAEDCDGSDLGGSTCSTIGMGFTGGALTCTGACTYDVSGCTAPPGCGNGGLDVGEQCDGALVGPETCSSVTAGALPEGTLACSLGCTYDIGGCHACGNGTVEASEECDGADFGGATCATASAGALPMGLVICTAGCTVDASQCHLCGNGTGEGTEACDGSDLRGNDCTSVGGGFSLGTLGCDATCAFDTTGCSGPPPVTGLNRDFNGDGYADIAIGADAYAYVDVYFGGATPDAVPEATMSGSGPDDYGYAVAPAGDVNGDGFGDLVVGAPRDSLMGTDAGLVHLYLGGAGGTFDTVPDTVIYGVAGHWFGVAVSSAGDVDGDGFDDVIVGELGAMMGDLDPGHAYIYRGGAGGLAATPHVTLTGEVVQDQFGMEVSLAGDVNGDGFGDVLVGAGGSTVLGPYTGRAYVFLGSAGAFDTTADATMTGEAANDYFGQTAAMAGDVNGDGFADVVIGGLWNDTAADMAGRAYIYFGAAGSSFDPVADVILDGTTVNENFGHTVCGASDLNGDGYDDVVIGSWQYSVGGAAFVFFGGASMDLGTDGSLVSMGSLDHFGQSLGCGGDVNGDGFPDVVVGAAQNDNANGVDAGSATLFYGGAGPAFDETEDLTYLGNFVGAYFGFSMR